jgi:glutathione synthase/RimK-type ligase-like ATP-grasp enzyme
MPKIRIYPHKAGSRGAKALAEALGGKVLRKQNSRYVRAPEDLIINWGASDSPFNGARVANQPNSIEAASNKLTCFRAMSEGGVRVPQFWTNRRDIPDDAFPVMCRTVLQGSEGRGIVVANNRNELVDAPLYTKYVKKQDEYRIHVMRRPGAAPRVISKQRKAKRNGVENADFKVRNLANGFVFVREGVNPPADVEAQAIAAVEATGLAFGAVDVIWNARRGEAYVLEINTAPGLEGQTVEDYANAFRHI